MQPFAGPRLKIERGIHHVEEMSGEVGDFLRRNPYDLAIEPDAADPAFRRIVLRQKEPLPSSLPLIIGDAVHNFRTALDHLACDLVRINNQPDDNVEWPVPAKGNYTKRSNICRAQKGAINLICELYKTGAGRIISGLHDLDIIDKHRLLIPVSQVVASDGHLSSFFSGGATTTFLPGAARDLTDDGAVLWRGADIEERHIGAKARAAFNIAFSGDTSFRGEPVIPFCRELSVYLLEIVNAFDNFIKGTGVMLPRAFFPRPAGLLMLK